MAGLFSCVARSEQLCAGNKAARQWGSQAMGFSAPRPCCHNAYCAIAILPFSPIALLPWLGRSGIEHLLRPGAVFGDLLLQGVDGSELGIGADVADEFHRDLAAVE